jgi:hypothetical protein
MLMDPAAKQKNTRGFTKILVALLVAGALGVGCAARTYPGPVHGLTFDGTVRSVDLAHRRLSLMPRAPSSPVVFAWDETTKFWKNGIPIKADEVEAGRSVRVHYHMMSGQFVAHHVYIQAPYEP